MAQLICPKCSGTMASYERNGVTVDQCQDCRGVFLDRGELERLIDAESGYYGATPSRIDDDSSGLLTMGSAPSERRASLATYSDDEATAARRGGDRWGC
jgi:Zn-finger nucleic acid-binding protein